MSKSKHSKAKFVSAYPPSGKKGDLERLRQSTVQSADTAQARDLPLTELHGRADAQMCVKRMYEKK